jgi:hypothetical protein
MGGLPDAALVVDAMMAGNQAGSNADSVEPVVCVNLVSKKTVRMTKADAHGRALASCL